MRLSPDYSSRFRILKGGKISLVVSALFGTITLSIAAPTGGIVTSGNANISQSGSVTNIVQSSSKASINWQSFNVGANEIVNFHQPSVNSITLNRIVGNEKSVIDGALNANGQVWLLNSNGVLFGKNASVNTGGLLVTTSELSDSDFQAGNYNFTNRSSASIINMGTINITDSGYAVLTGKEVSNEGSITVIKGKVHLVGADSVSINLNGNSLVDLTISKGVLDAMVENRGAVYADGGEIYLTTNAVDQLLRGVVNNTGILEANSFDDIIGKIELFAHGGTVNVGGSIDARNGFVETSGKEFNFQGANILSGYWLIDPVDITIDSTLATAIENALGTGDVTISTAGSNTPDTSGGESGSNGDITVNNALAWNANKLTLHAENNINFNASLTASGTASLALEYGQGSADGGSSTYTVADGMDMIIPTATAFTWKKGSSGTVTNLVFDNGNLRFGNSSEASINNLGSLLQPFYYDNVTNGRDGWFKLTYSSYPLDYAIGVGGDGTNTYNTNGDLMSTNPRSSGGFTTTDLLSGVSNFYLNIAGYKEKTGTIDVSMDVTTPNEGTLTTTNSYTLDQGATYVKTVTSVTNNTGQDKTNMRLWIGTRDDYVAQSDSNYKTKGNIGSNGFEAITTESEEAKAIIVSENTFESGEGAAVLFYSTTENTNTVIQSCCSFNNVIGQDPTTSPISLNSPQDGSYGLFLSLGTLPDTQTGSITWYYAAAPVSQLETTVNQVASSAGVPQTPTPTPEPTNNNDDVNKVVTTIVNTTAIKVEAPRDLSDGQRNSFHIEMPYREPLHVTNDFGFGENSQASIVSTFSDEKLADKIVTLEDIKAVMAENAPKTEGEKHQDGVPAVQDVRVRLSENSIVDIVNGGVNLPDGVSQEFFVVEQDEKRGDN